MLELDIFKCERCIDFLEDCGLLSLWETRSHADGLFDRVTWWEVVSKSVKWNLSGICYLSKRNASHVDSLDI